MTGGDDRFSDEEVEEILRRAVSARRPGALARRDGLSLEELKAVGEEVGIDSSALEAAAEEILRERTPSPRGVLGAPRVIAHRREVEGSIDPSAFPEVVSMIRRTMGQKGEVTELQGTLEWSSTSGTAERYVTLSGEPERVSIEASANMSSLATNTFLPLGFTGVVFTIIAFVAAAGDGSPDGMIAAFLILPVLYLVLRTVYGRFADREAARLEQVVDELAASLAEAE